MAKTILQKAMETERKKDKAHEMRQQKSMRAIANKVHSQAGIGSKVATTLKETVAIVARGSVEAVRDLRAARDISELRSKLASEQKRDKLGRFS